MKTQQAVAKFVKPLNNTLSNKITALNAGGCGHFAYEVGKQLKRLGIPFKIWVLETWNDDYEKKQYMTIKTSKTFIKHSDKKILILLNTVCFIKTKITFFQ